jgi:hypothetical protein
VKPSFIIPVFDLLEIGQTKYFDVRLKETAVRNFTADFIELQNLVGEIEFQESILSRRAVWPPNHVEAFSSPCSWQPLERSKWVGGGKGMKPERPIDRRKRPERKVRFELHSWSPSFFAKGDLKTGFSPSVTAYRLEGSFQKLDDAAPGRGRYTVLTSLAAMRTTSTGD